MGPEAAQFAASGPSLSLLQVAVYLVVIFAFVIMIFTFMAVASLPVFFAAMLGMEISVRDAGNLPGALGKLAKIFGLVFRNLRRNLIRTTITYVALFVLTGMLTLLYSIVSFLEKITQEREGSVQVIMTERFSIPSMMPRAYQERMKQILTKDLDPEYRPNIEKDFMSWSFVGGYVDPEKKTQENTLFILALEPDTIVTMLDFQGMSKDDMTDVQYKEMTDSVAKMKMSKKNIIVGQERLAIMNKKVGDKVKLYPIFYKGLELDFEIVGTFPAGTRWEKSAVMRMDYLNVALDQWKDAPKDIRSTNLIWIRMPNKQAYEQLASIVNDPKTFNAPQAKLETASAGISSFLDAYKDILWGMKFIVMPAIMAIMCLVVGITITIGVRERRTEMAVLKVLGFLPWQVTMMIITEAVLIGVFGGMLSTWLVYFGPAAIEYIKTTFGLKMQVAFFNNFKAPLEIVFYGPALGVIVGLLGSVVPSISSQKIKMADVFAQVT